MTFKFRGRTSILLDMETKHAATWQNDINLEVSRKRIEAVKAEISSRKATAECIKRAFGG